MSIILNGSTGITTPADTVTGNETVGGTLAVTGATTLSTITSPTATALTIQSAGTTAMTIDTSQNVGIGTSSPSTKLDVNGNIGGGSLNVFGTGVPANGINNVTTNALGFFTNGSERMRIDSSGNLLVGTTTGGFRFHVNGGGADTVNISNATFASGNYFIRFGVGSGTGTNVGYISYNGSGVTYSTTSDYRLKHSVNPMTTGLATVSALKPVTYKWNADNSDGEGFIAHELQSVIPFAVTGDKDAVDEEGNIKPQGVDYSKIVVHLVAAIQELEARLAALEAK
jgi:hypothetical protein